MRIIDTECHGWVAKLDDLLEHMPAGWVERLQRTAFHLPEGKFHPGGLAARHEGSGELISQALGKNVTAAILAPHQILSCVNWTDTKLGSVFASALNDHFIERVLPVDPRFRLALALSPSEPHLAAQEIERHAANPNVAAAFMALVTPHMGQGHYRPILEAAARHKLPLIIHPCGKEGQILGTPALGGTAPRYNGEWETLIWQVAGINISSLIYDGVFVDLPDLTVAFAGFGFEWAPPALWRMNAEWRALRIDIPWVTEPPTYYLGRNIRFIAGEIGFVPEDMVGKLAEMLPPNSLMYGSNLPFGDCERFLDPLPETLREKVAYQNAADTFGARVGAQPAFQPA